MYDRRPDFVFQPVWIMRYSCMHALEQRVPPVDVANCISDRHSALVFGDPANAMKHGVLGIHEAAEGLLVSGLTA